MNKHTNDIYLYPLPLPNDIQTIIAEYDISEPKTLKEYYNLNHDIVSIEIRKMSDITTNDMLYHLQTFKNIKYLDLKHYKNIMDDDLLSISSLPLQYLILCSYHIADVGLSYLTNDKSKCSSTLRYLDIRSGGITDNGLLHLRRLSLEHLAMNHCYYITDKGLGHLKTLPLRHLSIHYCASITDVGLFNIKSLPLQYLDLGNTAITDVGLGHIQNLKLEYLDLSGCGITDNGITYLRLMPLRHLSLFYCSYITDIGLSKLSSIQKHDSGKGVVNIKTDPLTNSFSNVMPLEYLDLRMCKRITDNGIMYLKKLPLQHVNITYCDNITTLGYSYLKHVENVYPPPSHK